MQANFDAFNAFLNETSVKKKPS